MSSLTPEPESRSQKNEPSTAVQQEANGHANEMSVDQLTPPSSPDPSKGVDVHLPDTLSSIMAVEPVSNSHYEEVKVEADAWIAKTLGYTEKQAARNSRADFTYLISFWAPNCDAEALRTLVDWQHWAFPWDDQFDEGHLMEDLHAAAEEIIHMTSILDDSHPPLTPEQNPIRYAFQVNWYRFRERSSPGLQHRYKQYLKHYMLGVLGQVGARRLDPTTLSVEAYLKFRRGTIGAMPCFCLVEYAEGIDLPQSIIDHPSIAICQEVAVDLVLLDNDLLSYRKDLEQGETLNVVSILRAQGHSLQGAIDEVGNMLDACYRRWYGAMAEIPIWGCKIDREVLRYLDGIRNVALGSLVWSFRTGRYFNREEGELVQKTRIMRLPVVSGE